MITYKQLTLEEKYHICAMLSMEMAAEEINEDVLLVESLYMNDQKLLKKA